jgi:hypothetical protein
MELWHTADKKRLLLVTLFLFILATMAIICIESQTPYYFTMEN